MSRWYLPATLDELAAAQGSGAVEVDAEAVEPADDSEEQEYAALMTAADASAARQQAPVVRVVVVVESASEPTGPVRLRHVAALHADDHPDADPDDDLAWWGVQELAALLAAHGRAGA